MSKGMPTWRTWEIRSPGGKFRIYIDADYYETKLGGHYFYEIRRGRPDKLINMVPLTSHIINGVTVQT